LPTPNPNFRPLFAVAPKPIILPLNANVQIPTKTINTTTTTTTTTKSKEITKPTKETIKKEVEKKTEKKIEEKKKEEKKKKPTDEFSITKIPKKKDKSEIEKKIESLMIEGNFKIENCKKLIEIMEKVQDENKIYIIKTLSKHSKFSFFKKFIQQNGLLILKNWLNNSPSKQLVFDIFQVSN